MLDLNFEKVCATSLGLNLANALEQTLANPTASHRWTTLMQLYFTDTDIDQQVCVQQVLCRQMPRDGEAGFFFATFMAEITSDAEYSALAARILQKIEPFDPDRVMAFCVYEWGRQAMGEGNRQQMTQALRLARVPESIQRIGRMLQAPPLTAATASAGGTSPLRRIAIIAPYISGPNHPPTLLALQCARLLADMGLQIHVFSAQEQRVGHMRDYLGSGGELHQSVPTIDTLHPYLAPGVSLTLCDEAFSVRRRCQDILHTLSDFAPDLVLFVGLFSPLMQPLHEILPTLGLCIHALQPMAPVDAWLCSDATLAQQNSQLWGHEIAPAWGIYHPYRVMLRPITLPVTRAELNLTDSDVVLISAGGRLGTEIGGEWAMRMLECLQQHPNAVWLLVGGTGTIPPALQRAAGTAIRTLQHQEDLRSILRCGDIYVNPPRLGGGFSVAEAMAEGLAVVTLAQGDGGDKVGHEALPTLDGYFEQLNTLIIRADTRKAMGRMLQQRFTDTLDLANSGTALLAACQITQERFRQNMKSEHG